MRPVPPMRRSRGEMLPLMDMIFLLLVVFIFQIVQMRPDFGISVELPDVGEKPERTALEQEVQTVTVSITADNQLHVNEAAVAPAELVEAVRARAAGADNEHIHIILRGDEKADYGRIMELFTLLRQDKLQKIIFDVDANETDNPRP